MNNPTMMTKEAVVDAINGSNKAEVARATGLHYNQVYRLGAGKVDRIHYDTIKKLSDYFMRKAS